MVNGLNDYVILINILEFILKLSFNANMFHSIRVLLILHSGMLSLRVASHMRYY